MDHNDKPILVGDTPLLLKTCAPSGEYVEVSGERFYRISHVDQMPPFFMSLVSGTDHWLFIASNGGLTAGRVDAESALFPYETEDKLIAHSDRVGGTTLLRVTREGRTHLWEPQSRRYAGIYRCERNLYKNSLGNTLIFEEINQDLHLTWRTTWRTSDHFGFVRSSELQNDGDGCEIALLDGLQNLLPYGATVALQTASSNLLHAYKRNELDVESGLGIFALSATLTDRAEPSESLMATVAWQVGLKEARHLLTTEQIEAFRHGKAVVAEQDERGKAGSYFVVSELALEPDECRRWHIVADVNQDSSDVVRLTQRLQQGADELIEQLEADIEATSTVLRRHIAAADGMQLTSDETNSAHHLANVMFNIMRGGILADGYMVRRDDLRDFVRTRNRPVLKNHAAWFDALPERIHIGELYDHAAESGSADLVRLCYEYLPLTFSRRHGDPSRPWNQFAIHLRHEDGTPRLEYQGNWRDIFQNWEPLLISFPTYIEGVIAKFLNATTVDGYNPYRVTRAGIEWEVPEPENPWANIGYWSDHQIIYLQKLLELSALFHPDAQQQLWKRALFTYANVPYRLRSYDEMLADWYDTIDFDWAREENVEEAVAEVGTDGRLLLDDEGAVVHVTMMEKLLVLLLAKLTNLVPEGGIWMNTQRPEWNDANNALVGKGLSVITAAYLRRFVLFWEEQLTGADDESFTVNRALATLLDAVQRTFEAYRSHLEGGFDDAARRAVMDELGQAATAYRATVYDGGLPSEQAELTGEAIRELLSLARAYLEQTLRANRRDDDLYHAYNILRLSEGRAAVGTLYPMLEGQVAMLSSGMLSGEESAALMLAMRESELYRADQHSYMLYPNRELPGFQEKNNVPASRVADSALVAAMERAGDPRLLVRDVNGDFHFNGHFRNAKEVAQTLDTLAEESAYVELVAAERDLILDLFEETFNHSAFTGRSGTFFAYEGLGSIYWHMVSKLLLAVQESYVAAQEEGAEPFVVAALDAAYYDVRAGLGYNKAPDEYGAFPTDPYSHTPWEGGASQPGMTGLVKEEILTRWGELGVSVEEGVLCFAPTLLKTDEFVEDERSFAYIDVHGERRQLSLPQKSLAFTLCQVPVAYQRGEAAAIEVEYSDGGPRRLSGSCLDAETTGHIISRNGQVQAVRVTVAI